MKGGVGGKRLAALHSMALPVVLFPSAVLSSFSGLLIPECAELEGRGERRRLGRLSGRALSAAFLFAVGAAALLFLGASELGWLLYRNADAGRYIRLLSPLVPVMYLDSVVDAHLKGMGYQVYSMGINIADAAISVAAVLLLLPRFGADGYIYVIYLTELFNFAFSVAKLFSLIRPRLARSLLAAVPFSLLAALFARFAVTGEHPVCLVLRLSVAAAAYLATVAFFGIGETKKEDTSFGYLSKSGEKRKKLLF